MLSHLTMWRNALDKANPLECGDIVRNLRDIITRTLEAVNETQELRDALSAAKIATRRWVNSQDDRLHAEAIKKLDQAIALAKAAGPTARSRNIGIG